MNFKRGFVVFLVMLTLGMGINTIGLSNSSNLLAVESSNLVCEVIPWPSFIPPSIG